MEQSEWRDSILDTVQAAPRAVLKTEPRSAKELDFDFVEVEYPDHPNTLQTLARASDEVKDHTRVIVRTDRDTIQFKFTQKERMDSIEAIPLIQRILDEDVPVRRQFQPTYTIHDNCVLVESPELSPVRLFENTLTRIWRLTGVYEKDGVYHQRFEQERPHESVRPVTEDSVERYGRYRLQQVSWSVSVPCPDCGGDASLAPSEMEEKTWTWRCADCSSEYGRLDSLDMVLNDLEPLWNRERIRETVRDVGFDTVHG